MPRSLVLAAVLLITPSPARAGDPPPVAVRVTTAAGKPAAGAKVWVYPDPDPEARLPPAEPTPIPADADGKLTIPGETGPRRSIRHLFARDPAGRVGYTAVGQFWDPDPGPSGVRIVLADGAARAGRITAADGNPVAGAVVVPTSYSAEGNARATGDGPAPVIELPAWETTRLGTRTGPDGRFRLAAPVGYGVSFRVTAAGFGETLFTAPAGVDLDAGLIAPGTVTITPAGVEASALKGLGWHLFMSARPAAAPGVRPVRWKTGTFDGSGPVTVRDVVPGRYEVGVSEDGRVPAVFVKADPVEVAAGKTAAVTASFGPAARVTGRVTDMVTGKAVPGAALLVNVHTDDRLAVPTRQFHVTTDGSGEYAAHGPPGWYIVWAQTAPDGYAVPYVANARQGLVEPARVAVGRPHAFAPIALPRAVTLAGRVVFPDGKPAGGATLSLGGVWTHTRADRTTAADDGTFAIKNLPPDDAVAPRVRLGTAVNVPQTFDLEKTTRPVSIEVSEANAAGFRGRVTDAKGVPVAGAKVTLRHSVPGVGRNASTGTNGPAATTTTDADGRYTFAGFWPRDTYSVAVAATGYAGAGSKSLTGAAGEVQEFGPLKLGRAGLAVRGVVRDAVTDKPVGGAEVFGVDGPARVSTASAADGSFTLSGYYEGGGFVFVRQPGYRPAAVPVVPGGPDPVTVPLTPAAAPPGPQPAVPPAHAAALDRFTRHLLTRTWEVRADFGYGSHALLGMARIDLDVAKKWRDEEKTRTGGTTDLTRHLERAVRDKTLFDTAKADVDEAVAVLAQVPGEDGFTETLRLGEQLLPVDRAGAARLAEEAVVRARQREFPAKVWALAEAGDLAVRAGNGAGGTKILLEAAALAGKIDAAGRDLNAYAVGMVAARLAPHDWPRAEVLLGGIKDPGEYNRWLAAAAGRLAAVDLPGAKRLFDRFRVDNSSYPSEARLRVAFRIAAARPDEAVKVVEGVAERAYQFHGYLGLARRFAPADRGRAAKMIDAAFDLLDGQPEAFRSWGNFGGRAGFGATAVVRAREIGYPDVAGLVARTLAMRPTGADAWSPEDRADQLVNIAAALAIVDPGTARGVLAGVAPPDELPERASRQRRDWLFALALADPERATVLVDKLIDRAKEARNGGNGLSQSGLVELGSILTDTDRLRTLTVYGSLLREIDDE
ncbi:MAG: hypothetical protein JWO38_3407 [Gemmataceae bacterium]|nr:hypothetical protein [Gemmataceae bacterium]